MAGQYHGYVAMHSEHEHRVFHPWYCHAIRGNNFSLGLTNEVPSVESGSHEGPTNE